MDVRYINPFISASRKVFDAMIHVPLQLSRPYVRTHGHPDYSVSAVIGIGGAVTGSIILGFSQRVALALASGLAGNTFAEIDRDCIDAIGEIINMIAGAAKAQFPGGQCTISCPSVILGSHQVNHPSQAHSIIIPCQTPAGPFTLEVAIQAGSAPADPAPAQDFQQSRC